MTGRRDLDSVGEPAFAIDIRQVITEWNAAAERAFGHRSEVVVGRSCHEILCGEDIHGNAFCRENCNILRLVQREAPVRSFVASVRCASGQRVPVRMAILPAGNRRGRTCRIVHLALTLSQPGGGGVAIGSHGSRTTVGRRAPDAPELTRAEVDVLRRIAIGLTTNGIAAASGVSPATVRTHVRNLLRKLGAHTRAEALHISLQDGLLR